MRAVDIIRQKRDGGELTSEAIRAFVEGATSGVWPDYQVSVLLMAIFLRGMSPHETADLTGAMIDSGKRLDLSEFEGIKVDKHSTGGVGDKTSMILAPLASACGAIVPMMSGRGLGHTGGTLDKLESIPGFRVRLSEDELREALGKVGCALIGQTDDIAPADRKLYSLRDVTSTVESIPLISASIMSKKIAEGIGALVLDVKTGRGAFMSRLEDARLLAASLVQIGQAHGVHTEAIITQMSSPLGRDIGNSLEIIESIETLKGKGPEDLESLSVELAARMLRLAQIGESTEEAEKKVREALSSGAGLEQFRKIIEKQNGDPRVIDDYSLLPRASHRENICADSSGFVTSLDAYQIGVASMMLGAGREKAEDSVDPSVGIRILRKPGEPVQKGDPILELHFNEAGARDRACEELQDVCVIGEEEPAPSLILESHS